MASFLEKMSGTKPKLPAWTPIDITKEQQATVAGNQATLPGAQTLATSVNTFNQSELDRLYNQALPGYDRIKQNVSDYLSSTTGGQLPDDVADEIYRRTTSRATAGGFGGSGIGRNLTARDLGLTSLDLIDRGISSAQRWLSTQAAPRFDVTSMFLSPAQRIPMAMEERNLKFQHDYLRAQIKAMPDPATKYWTDGVTNLLMGAGNYWGGDYQTTPTSEWGAGSSPQMNTGGGGGGGYMPQQSYNGGGYNSFSSNYGAGDVSGASGFSGGGASGAGGNGMAPVGDYGAMGGMSGAF